jgi:hypothetical protein
MSSIATKSPLNNDYELELEETMRARLKMAFTLYDTGIFIEFINP